MNNPSCNGIIDSSANNQRKLNRLERSKLIWQTIRAVRRMAFQETDLNVLLHRICKTLVAEGRYYNAWACLLTDQKLASCCVEENVNPEFQRLSQKLEAGSFTSCIEKALSNKALVMTGYPYHACIDCPLTSSYMGRGAFTVPLICESSIIGLLCVSIPVKFIDDPEEIFLFEELAYEVSLSVGRLQIDSRLCQSQRMEALGSLAGGVAHEFNNILGVITGYSELALDSLGEETSVEEDIKYILKAADRGKGLVRQLILYSRVKSPKLQILDLNQAISDGLALADYIFPKMVKMNIYLMNDLPPIKGDMAQIEALMLSLIRNAGGAMPEGGQLTIQTKYLTVTNKTCSTCGEKVCGDYLLLSVIDTGIGMNDEKLPKIFDPFCTAKDVETMPGLGLSAVLRIVKNHSGHIEYQSKPGKGTIVKVLLPIHEGELNHTNSEGESMGIPVDKCKLLLVDDEEVLCHMCAKMLATRGYEVTMANSGEEAVDLYKKNAYDFDCIITDLSMPGMGGKKAIEEILRINPKAKVIVTSGYIDGGDKRNALESSIAGYLSKPFRKDDLFDAVKRVLHS